MSTDTAAVVRATVEDRVLEIVLDRPPANALGAPIVDGLTAAVARLADDDVRAVLVRSAVPGYFAAGADIKQMGTLDGPSFAAYRDALRHPLEALAASRVPSVAAIDGLALGGGLELAMACTLRLATPASTVGLPEVKLGLIPGAGGTQRLTRVAGRGVALDLMLTGRSVDGTEAHRLGIVDRLVDGDVVTEARALARGLAASSAPAVASIIACVDAAAGDVAAGMAFEGEEVVRMITEGEAPEGIAAFLEKRRPVWA
ncbi:enoyl-CoA hydratase/isomerase family protein [Paraconexibacter algicola]|uniref:enoyl-CoA hydratase n=1 Tax=Paraconexibacter algicola TaxID=2133960 RepID=A0A2T4UJW2_9ACTN|nr:enoyl-CoA hydratase/isomerase family protein [Paraconexibacter algicola]PTL59519.1 enoyl-CoA hydratase [Paraconexibacter algicola]